ncbi:hypothetical protein BDBG_02744 [Blastomyces gilchristii SLH14081]|uniref:Uncharacterized protein n=1 Tax=Blastomyces gilchristii (strain SLH14081) TaxID=559298 RepID=A0A179UH20_BLAGS|nr:uncharacterized protein BDBG_02744 [Blastomyces gilchristii SLH14081]OAT06558.1 hypothetical protein BDBG_02744 [Blastomyces gilchristii SLH14081]
MGAARGGEGGLRWKFEVRLRDREPSEELRRQTWIGCRTYGGSTQRYDRRMPGASSALATAQPGEPTSSHFRDGTVRIIDGRLAGIMHKHQWAAETDNTNTRHRLG